MTNRDLGVLLHGILPEYRYPIMFTDERCRLVRVLPAPVCMPAKKSSPLVRQQTMLDLNTLPLLPSHPWSLKLRHARARHVSLSSWTDLASVTFIYPVQLMFPETYIVSRPLHGSTGQGIPTQTLHSFCAVSIPEDSRAFAMFGMADRSNSMLS